MQRNAQKEDQFYEEQESATLSSDGSDNEDDDDDEDDDDEDDDDMDRRGRFREAYNIALATDTQGYQLSKIATALCSNDSSLRRERTPQQLAAISWAAFCTEPFPEQDATVRIRALDCDNLFDRLKMAMHMLGEKKTALKNAMKEAGLKISNEDTEDDL
mmetsp:Transcript_4906/g.12956  ORF Transcript_4906/g.12956 Transcript_4906/m.12956 type:complete len:159 (-) Transcript_4906:372-848(-)|eukprot:CAMPEP_0198112786 /NCGR_PEP_ID=MMETSP1442-20131203/4584_1 /TAXON_ID= /ORGANISM="Craspedostauros australis, Strain CCMP3328" /LENGTH=158 /DNA_ID=CAMNT_0043769687 /DNA_START=206 /DNA_END=682 /DNA_ORIENTATION=-